MKGLLKIPSSEAMNSAFDHLQGLQPKHEKISCKKLAFYSQWTRFEPRLAEIWISYVRVHWKSIHPYELNQILKTLAWPSAAGVLLDLTYSQILASDKKGFHAWKECSLVDILPNSSHASFFIGQRAFGGLFMIHDAQFALKPYLKWGYFGCELIQNKETHKGQTLIPKESRRALIDHWLKSTSRITTQQYQELLGNRVSIRQAEYDLVSHPRLIPIGHTRGRFYRLKAR